jgi:hypothetical protein
MKLEPGMDSDPFKTAAADRLALIAEERNAPLQAQLVVDGRVVAVAVLRSALGLDQDIYAEMSTRYQDELVAAGQAIRERQAARLAAHQIPTSDRSPGQKTNPSPT